MRYLVIVLSMALLYGSEEDKMKPFSSIKLGKALSEAIGMKFRSSGDFRDEITVTSKEPDQLIKALIQQTQYYPVYNKQFYNFRLAFKEKAKVKKQVVVSGDSLLGSLMEVDSGLLLYPLYDATTLHLKSIKTNGAESFQAGDESGKVDEFIEAFYLRGQTLSSIKDSEIALDFSSGFKESRVITISRQVFLGEAQLNSELMTLTSQKNADQSIDLIFSRKNQKIDSVIAGVFWFDTKGSGITSQGGLGGMNETPLASINFPESSIKAFDHGCVRLATNYSKDEFSLKVKIISATVSIRP